MAGASGSKPERSGAADRVPLVNTTVGVRPSWGVAAAGGAASTVVTWRTRELMAGPTGPSPQATSRHTSSRTGSANSIRRLRYGVGGVLVRVLVPFATSVSLPPGESPVTGKTQPGGAGFADSVKICLTEG